MDVWSKFPIHSVRSCSKAESFFEIEAGMCVHVQWLPLFSPWEADQLIKMVHYLIRDNISPSNSSCCGTLRFHEGKIIVIIIILNNQNHDTVVENRRVLLINAISLAFSDDQVTKSLLKSSNGGTLDVHVNSIRLTER